MYTELNINYFKGDLNFLPSSENDRSSDVLQCVVHALSC